MVNAVDKRSMRTDLYLSKHQTLRARQTGGRSVARAIGILTILLMIGGSAFGQFMIQPMKINVDTYPNRRPVTTFAIENQNQDASVKIDLRLLDMTQDSSGMWQTIEPDAQVVADPNGARWVDVGTEGQPIRVDVSKLRSCLEWLRIEQDVVELDPLQRKVMNLWIRIPPGVQGYYCAALIAQTQLTPDVDTGIRTPVLLQFLVPVIINVQGRPIRDEIKLTGINLTYRPAEGFQPAATLVTVGVSNEGMSCAQLVGVTRVYGKRGDHWQKITEMSCPQTSIIPGVKINLQKDMERPLPSGQYRVAAALYVNGHRAGVKEEEIEFQGDDRIIEVAKDATLDLSPREVEVDVRPGATRTTIMTVTNSSEDPVTVDAALLLPDHMTARAWNDGQGNSVRGQDFGCVDWVTIQPTQFRLRGYARQNIKIVSKMPRMTNPLPNYYATIKLRATYEDGQTGGVSQGLIYLTTPGVVSTPRAMADQLSVSESSPSRYLVTASFSNIGNTHIQPRCRAYLTQVVPGTEQGQTVKIADMSSASYDQRGNMLPLETRQFTGVLDIASVAEGKYRLTVALQYAGGAAEQNQTAVNIKREGGAKVIDIVSLDSVGGKVQIQL